MAWKQVKVEEQRKNFIHAVLTDQKDFKSLCQEYDISRKTGYKWLKRYQSEGLDGLCDKSTAPHSRPHAIEDYIINQILEVRIKNPRWGPKKVYGWLVNNKPNIDWPTPSSIGNIFDRFGLTVKRKIRRRLAESPFSLNLGNKPNDVWSFDFKGTIWTTDGNRGDPFTLTDNVSRFLIKCQILKANNGQHVWACLSSAFREYGLPKSMLSDNGPPFATIGAGRLSKISINLIKVGVIPTWITPGKPQQNGRHERMHGTLEGEVNCHPIHSKIELSNKLQEFQNHFNFERPHEALGQKTPGSCYTYSDCRWDGVLRSPEYSNEYKIRKVQKCGTINLNGIRIFISEALWGEPVGIIENEIALQVYYGPILLGSINEEWRLEIPRIKSKKS